MPQNDRGIVKLNVDAEPHSLRYWIGYPTGKPLDDLACHRVEEIVNNKIGYVSGFDAHAVEARAEYVLAVVDGVGVAYEPQTVTDQLAGLVREYNQRYPSRPSNDAVELDIPHRVIGTLGIEASEDDLDVARELLRERGASPDDVAAGGEADTAEDGEHA